MKKNKNQIDYEVMFKTLVLALVTIMIIGVAIAAW